MTAMPSGRRRTAPVAPTLADDGGAGGVVGATSPPPDMPRKMSRPDGAETVTASRWPDVHGVSRRHALTALRP